MKRLKSFLLASLLGVVFGIVSVGILSQKSYGVGAFVPDYMYQTCVTSMTVNKVLVSTASWAISTSSLTVSSNVWTNTMDTPGLSGRVWMEIQNNSTTSNLWCNTSTATLTTGGGIGTGFEIGTSTNSADVAQLVLPLAYSAYTGATFNGTNSLMHFYCVSDGVTGSTATVIQCY